MPLYKPKFLSPNENVGDGVVDISKPFQPTCVVDGNVPINAYKIDILKLNDDGYIIKVFDDDISCKEDGILVVPSDKKPIKTMPIYTTETGEYGSVLTNVDENGNLVRPEGKAPFEVDRTYHVQYAYVFNSTFYSTEKQNQLFYPINEIGKYNIFTPLIGIAFEELPESYLKSEYIKCSKDGNITLSCDVYSKDDMVIYRVGNIGAIDGSSYNDLSINDLVYDKNKISMSAFSNGMYYLIQYRATNNKTEPYKYTISFWDQQNDTDDSPTVTSDFAVFYANSVPTIEIFADGTKIEKSSYDLAKRSCTFSIDYIDTYSSIKWFGWILKNKTTGEVIEDTISKNQIYGVVGNVKYTYDGFLSGESYEIMFKVITQNNMSAEISKNISVSYAAETIETNLEVLSIPNECGVLCEWSDIKVAVGETYGKTEYIENYPIKGSISAKIYENSYIYFSRSDGSNFAVDDSSYIVISFQCKGNAPFKNVDLLTLRGSDNINNRLVEKRFYINEYSKLCMEISYYGQTITKIESDSFICGEEYWNFIILKPDGSFSEIIYKANGALTPNSNLVPSNNLYPSNGIWEFIHNIDYPNEYEPIEGFYYNAMVIGGRENEQKLFVDFIYTSSDEIESSMFANNFISDNDINIKNYEFFAKFDNNLNAGNTIIESLDSFEIRRRKNANTYTEFVANIDTINTNFIVDYMVGSGCSYSYYLYPKNEENIMYPMMSEDIKPVWDHYCLMVVDDTDTDNLFYLSKMFIFKLNLNTGDLSNNTDIEVVKNFTPYPFVQASPSNYWSGSLTSLIGFIHCDGDSGEYRQTPQMMNELKSLTTDTRRKFLKDMEGNIFEIQISSDLSIRNADDAAGMLKEATINWVEVGDVLGLSVINNPNFNVNAWLLTNTGIASPYINYVWDDNDLWDDTKYWTGNNGALSVE